MPTITMLCFSLVFEKYKPPSTHKYCNYHMSQIIGNLLNCHNAVATSENPKHLWTIFKFQKVTHNSYKTRKKALDIVSRIN